MVYLTVILLFVLDSTTYKTMNQICKYASNKELAAMVAVQQRQTLIMSKCQLCEYALRDCCE